MQVAESVGLRYAVPLSHLDERQRRLTLASEAAELGRGGIKKVTEAVSSLVLLGFGSDRQSVWETARSERDEPAGLRAVPPDEDIKVLVTASLPPGRLITYRSIMPVDPEANGELPVPGTSLDRELAGLRDQMARLRSESTRLLRLLDLTPAQARPPGPAQTGIFDGPAAMVDASSSLEAKVALFASMFAARSDVYAVHWENSCTGRSGWMPAR